MTCTQQGVGSGLEMGRRNCLSGIYFALLTLIIEYFIELNEVGFESKYLMSLFPLSEIAYWAKLTRGDCLPMYCNNSRDCFLR